MEESRTQPLPAASAASTLPSPSKSSPAQEQQPQLQTASEDTAKSQPKSQPKGEDNTTTTNKNQNQNKKPNKMPPKPPPTHFLCIPLVTASSRSQLTRSLAAFREEVTAPGNPSSSAYGALPVPEEAIRPVGTIHLTLGVMSFLEPRESKGVKTGRGGGDGQGQAGQVGGNSGRDGPQEDNGRRDRSRSRSGSRSGGEEQRPPSGSGSLSGLGKLEEAKALLKSLKLKEIWQEVLRQSQTQATAVPVPRDSNDGGAPIAIGTAEEKGEGVEAGMGTVIREVPPQIQSETGKKEEEEDIKITLKGLHSMQSPSKAAVLYAPPVDPLGHLQRFCEKVKAEFVQKELMMEEGGRPLLLHATVVNTIYVKGGRGRGQQQQQQQQQGGGNRGGGRGGKKGHHGHRGGGNKRERLTIDAREILERYEEYTWMEDVKVEKVAICKMGAKKEMVDGVVVNEAYEVEEEVEF